MTGNLIQESSEYLSDPWHLICHKIEMLQLKDCTLFGSKATGCLHWHHCYFLYSLSPSLSSRISSARWVFWQLPGALQRQTRVFSHLTILIHLYDSKYWQLDKSQQVYKINILWGLTKVLSCVCIYSNDTVYTQLWLTVETNRMKITDGPRICSTPIAYMCEEMLCCVWRKRFRTERNEKWCILQARMRKHSLFYLAHSYY